MTDPLPPPETPKPPRDSDNHPGSELSPAAVEFAAAMRRYQMRYGRRYPAWSEVLAVAHSLGYRRCPVPAPASEGSACSASPASVPSGPPPG